MGSRTDDIVTLPLSVLAAHPYNSNVMRDDAFATLKAHLETHDRYPPLIVRPLSPASREASEESAQRYQLLDGHHRAAALRDLGCDTARCVVWDVDDAGALVLLATLNRLRGRDDPRKRAALLTSLSERFDRKTLAAQLPETGEQLSRLLALGHRPPPPRPPQKLADMPVAVHFFLLPAQRRALEAALRRRGGPREAALMALVAAGGADE